MKRPTRSNMLWRGLRSAPLIGLLTLVGCAIGNKTGPASTAGTGAPPRSFVYVGTAIGTIEIFALDEASGSLGFQNKVSTGGAVAALGGLPFEHNLVTVDDRGAVASFSVEPKNGGLRVAGRGSAGAGRPGRLLVDQSGKFILVANRSAANVAVLAVRPGGQLAAPEFFPAGAGALGLSLHPTNTLLFVANSKGGTLSQLSFNAGTGALTAKPGSSTVGLPAGSGPRQIVCHPNGRLVYVLNESSSTVSAHAFDDRMGTITPLSFQSISTLGTSGVSAPKSARATDLAIAPTGRFVYALNRGDDSLVSFGVDNETGALTFANRTPSGGSGAVALAFDPTGKFLFVINGESRHVATFRIDESTGVPTLTDSHRLDPAPTALFALHPAPA